jgi:hypothetical protein
MGLKNEIKIGDSVLYKDSGEFVYSLWDGEYTPTLSIVVGIRSIGSRLCVVYDDGGFDYYEQVQTIPSLLLELT